MYAHLPHALHAAGLRYTPACLLTTSDFARDAAVLAPWPTPQCVLGAACAPTACKPARRRCSVSLDLEGGGIGATEPGDSGVPRRARREILHLAAVLEEPGEHLRCFWTVELHVWHRVDKARAPEGQLIRVK
eukprot:CAMPEP_0115855582 /NCGR_PEP_ID=MMETSP0287-20121206/14616_1 /TAXON_ID=412157 /ORGANISM="Chrysochromulina rotalis, Strain UIO044" /LENGTH=131 /DNA_ID=CAMNT_0003309739 /DNA_START=148 /DNA_END=543 /DNA_ORIENTATION=-